MNTVLERVEERSQESSAAEAETVWTLIESRVKAAPKRAAVLDHGTEIDYERLARRAEAIARALASRGVEPGSLVAVCMSRTWELVAALLGVLRAGCAYVPLDPAYPSKRLRSMLDHAGVAAVVVDDASRARLDDPEELFAEVPDFLRVEQVGEGTADGAPTAKLPEARPEDLAYVLYTSGSTGKPKGVAVEHRNVVALIRALGTLLSEDDLSGVLAAASVCFDASVAELLGTLCLGGTVVLADNALELPELPAADRVRSLITVPSAMRALLRAGRLPAGLRNIFLGGEVLTPALVSRLHAPESWAQPETGTGPGKGAGEAPRPRVINVYGPTETTVFVTTAEVAEGEAITIGRPVPGTRAYVLNEALEPVPAGETGELYLAGDQLARGYLHDEARTKERFLDVAPEPTRPDGSPAPEPLPGRLYKTGDLCRWTDGGELEFLGRIDQQVKVRGFRIEIEEIESVLETMEGVEGAAAAVVDGAGDRQILAVYMVSRGGAASGGGVTGGAVSGRAARAYLAARLPGFMVPQVVVHVDELPRLPNGKLDRSALPALDGAALELALREGAALEGAARDGDPEEAAPGTGGSFAGRLAGLAPEERRALLLATVQEEIASLLGLSDPGQVPADSSGFDLGLDSLTTVELSARLSAVLGRKLPAAVVMERTTPAAVADALLDVMAGAAEPASEGKTRRKGYERAFDNLGNLQAQMRSSYPLFLAAKAPAWSADDKAKTLRELKRLVSSRGQDPHSKVVRTGSGHRGTVADAFTGEERETIIWTTNLYLGLNRDRDVIAEAGAALERFGTGMGTSAIAGGVTDLHRELEEEFADLVGKPSSCLFPTGYTANLGVVAGVLGTGDVVVMDQLCHASIVDGARLSGAKIRTFKHNSASDLEAVLRSEASPYRTVLVVLEGVYSMGEGAAPVAEIAKVAKRHGALVLVDEAHSFGFYGPRGAGICAAQGATDDVDFIMTTLSKAMGSLGGVVAASEEHVTLLKSSARAFIFQASNSPADIAAALAALRRLREDDALRERLWDTTAYMRRRFTEAGYDLGSGDTPVITPLFDDKDRLFAVVDGLFERGILASAVTYPVVEAGKGRLRLICSAAHTRDDVDQTLEALLDADREAGEQLQASPDAAGIAHPGRPGLEAWAEAFATHLRETFVGASGPTPNVAVSVALPDEEPVTVALHGGEVTVGEPAPEDTARCTLLLTDARVATALCAGDVSALLAGVLKGACVLSGEIEPFFWWVGRMVGWAGGSVLE